MVRMHCDCAQNGREQGLVLVARELTDEDADMASVARFSLSSVDHDIRSTMCANAAAEIVVRFGFSL